MLINKIKLDPKITPEEKFLMTIIKLVLNNKLIVKPKAIKNLKKS
jgi:hypothetical protein